MIQHLQRAELLLQQQRYDGAEGELRLYLAENPEDGYAHGLLAVALLRQEKYEPAEQEARLAIGHAPTSALSHYVLGCILLERRKLAEAEQAIDAAIALDPNQADFHAMRGGLALQRYQWQKALEAAEEGIRCEPDHLDCINIRAQALVKLGRQEEASRTLGEALAQAPDNSDTHANQGWSLLHQNQPKQALEHFREALRLDPENEFARIGMVEALKARNLVYRGMLQFFLWMARLPPRFQFGVVIGGFIGSRLLKQMAAANQALAPLVMPIIVVYAIFAVMTWVADPLFNLLLRVDRFGKYALSDDQRTGSTVFGLTLAITLVGALAWLAGELLAVPILVGLGFVLAFVFGLSLIPVSIIWKCDAGWPRWTMGLYTLGLIGFGLATFLVLPVALAIGGGSEGIAANFVSMFLFGVVASQFLANGLLMVRPRR